jgi:hypothetical protein
VQEEQLEAEEGPKEVQVDEGLGPAALRLHIFKRFSTLF